MGTILSLAFWGQAMADTILLGMVYGLVGLGLALIWGVADIINFAYGNYLIIAMLMSIFAANTYGIDPLIFIWFNVIVMFFAGYITYKTIIRPVVDGSMMSEIFVTFGLFLVLEYGVLWFVGPETRKVQEYVFEGSVEFAGIFVSIPLLVAGLMNGGAVLLLYLFLKKTKTGKAIRAVSQDKEVAQVLGIDPDRIYALTWGIGIASVGFAGTLISPVYYIHPETAPITWTMIAFAAVAFGGFGNIFASVLGGFGIAFVEQFGTRLFDPSLSRVYIFLVFLFAILIRQTDLMYRVKELQVVPKLIEFAIGVLRGR